jgi:hypothetical protein
VNGVWGKKDEEREERLEEGSGVAWGSAFGKRSEEGVVCVLDEESAAADDVSHGCLSKSKASQELECEVTAAECGRAVLLCTGDEHTVAAA